MIIVLLALCAMIQILLYKGTIKHVIPHLWQMPTHFSYIILEL